MVVTSLVKHILSLPHLETSRIYLPHPPPPPAHPHPLLGTLFMDSPLAQQWETLDNLNKIVLARQIWLI